MMTRRLSAFVLLLSVGCSPGTSPGTTADESSTGTGTEGTDDAGTSSESTTGSDDSSGSSESTTDAAESGDSEDSFTSGDGEEVDTTDGGDDDGGDDEACLICTETECAAEFAACETDTTCECWLECWDPIVGFGCEARCGAEPGEPWTSALSCNQEAIATTCAETCGEFACDLCLGQQCDTHVEACLADATCVCWAECAGDNSDEQCMETCGESTIWPTANACVEEAFAGECAEPCEGVDPL